MKVLVAYDGTLDSKAALKYGIRKVREYGGELIAFHVFQSHQFADNDTGPKAEAIARLEAMRHVAEARKLLRESGRSVRASLALAEGNALDEVIGYSRKKDVDLIVATPALESLAGKACCLTDIVSVADEAVPELADIPGGGEGTEGTGTWRSL